MGEGLVITASFDSASKMLKVIKDPHLFHWEWSPEHLDVTARWLSRKGFTILPKIFDRNYNPGTVGDEADKLIKNIGACYLEWRKGRDKPIPIWNSRILKQPQMREELNTILNGTVLDIDFEEEILNELEKKFGDAGYEADEQALEDDNKTLKRFAEILMKLADCMDQVLSDLKQRGEIPYVEFEFYIPRY
jgi:hypothetical protein